MKYPNGSVVKMPAKPGRGVVLNVFPIPEDKFRYGVQWDAGPYQVCEEKEIQWATVDRPKMYGSLV